MQKLSSAESDNSTPSEVEIRTSFESATTSRRFKVVPLPDGTHVRLRSLKRSEMMGRLRTLSESRHFDALITLAVVDENGDTIWACGEESFVLLDEMDYQLYEALLESVKAFCTNGIDYEAAIKN